MHEHNAPTISQMLKSKGLFGDTAAICPHCGTVATFQGIVQQTLQKGVGDLPAADDNLILVAFCRACRKLLFGCAWKQTDDFANRRYFATLIWPQEQWRRSAPPNVPQHIRAVYEEACSVLPISAKASAVLARRCVQQVIREVLSIKERDLFTEIAVAQKRDELAKPTRAALDHVRTIGNWGAHPIAGSSAEAAKSDIAIEQGDQSTTIIDVTREESEYTLRVVELLFHDLYATPAATAAMKQKIDAKK